MKKIFLRDMNGQEQNPYLVRYFKYQDNCYLIYTFHEIDENNFMTLYIVKVMEESGFPVAKYLSDDQEWEKMRNAIKQMLEEIINKQVISFEDINVDTNFEMQVETARSFKLLATLVETLSGENGDTVLKEKTIETENEISSNENRTSYIAEDKISVIEYLKQKYKPQEQKNQLFQVTMEIDLQNICPIVTVQEEKEESSSTQEKMEFSSNIMDDPLQEEFEHMMVDSAFCRKLQEENDTLRQQLLQYQVKYETLKNLLKTE